MVGIDFLTNLFIGGGIIFLVFLVLWNALLPELTATPVVLAVMFMIPIALLVKILRFAFVGKKDERLV